MAKQRDKRKNSCYLSLGTNLGNRTENLSFALKQINLNIGRIIKMSSLYESEAWGNAEMHPFYNMLVELNTDLAPIELLEANQRIEKMMGRVKLGQSEYENRIIDIDIILFEQLELNEAKLQIPHPQTINRKFVLMPLNEISKDLFIRKWAKDVGQLLTECEDKTDCRRIKKKLPEI